MPKGVRQSSALASPCAASVLARHGLPSDIGSAKPLRTAQQRIAREPRKALQILP